MIIENLTIQIGSSEAPAWAVDLVEKLEQLKVEIMAKIEDKVAELDGVLNTIGAGVAGVQGDVATLSAEIQALKDQIGAGGNLTPEQEAAFDAAIVKARAAADALDALDQMNPATPSAPVEPPVEPTPEAPPSA